MRRQFKLEAHAGQPDTKGYRLPVLRIQDRQVYFDDNLENRVLVTEDKLTRRTSERAAKIFWSREVEANLYEHGLMHLSHHKRAGQGVVLLSKDADEADPKSKSTLQMITFRATNQATVGDTSDSFTMQYSADIWASNTPTPSMTNPVSFGTLGFETVQTGGSTGMSIPVITIPLLDQLCETINSTLASSGLPAINSLYTSSVNLGQTTSGSNSTSIVTFSANSMVAAIADQPVGSTTTSLTFKNSLNSDIVLPMLFQQIYVVEQANGVTGSIYEADATMRGSLGNRHYFASATTPSVLHDAHEDVDGSKTASPAAVTKVLEQFMGPSIEDLMLLSGYNDPDVQNKTQQLIQDTMLYWMDQSIVTNVLGLTKPTDLPIALTTDLDPHIQTWLYNTYGPAYVANQLCYIDPDKQQSWRSQITQQQQIQIRYWWSGWGANCLAQSTFYQTLSTIAFKQAMVALYPRLTVYQAQSSSWAAQLDAALKDPQCLRSLTLTPFSGNTNYTNKMTNILRVLDVHNQYGTDISNAFFATSLANLLAAPYIDSNAADIGPRTEYLTDAFVTLATVVFGGSVSGGQLPLTSDVQTGLLADLTSMEKALNLNSAAPAATRATNLSNALPSAFVPTLSEQMSTTINNKVQGLKTRFSQIQIWITDTKAKVLAPGSPLATSVDGAFALVSLAFLIKDGIDAISVWDDSSPSERAALILSGLAGAAAVAGKFLTAWETFTGKLASSPLQSEVASYGLDDGVWYEMQDVTTQLSQEAVNIEPGTEIPMESRISNKINQGEIPETNYEVPEPDSNVPNVDPLETSVSFEDALDRFATTANALSAAWTVLNIGVIISGSITLAQSWGTLNNTGKALNVLNIAVNAVGTLATEFVADAINLVAVYATEEVLIDATIMSALPGVGIAIAGIGIAFTFLLVFLNTKKPPPPPPPTPVELFISNNIPPLLAQWPQPPPKPRLTYTVPSSVTTGQLTTFQIVAENPTSNAVQMDSVTFTLRQGSDTACTFSDMTMIVTTTIDPQRNVDGKAYVDQNNNSRLVISPSKVDANAMQFDYKVTGTTLNASIPASISPTPLILGPTSGFRLTISAMGVGTGGTTSVLQIMEGLINPRDSAYLLYDIKP